MKHGLKISGAKRKMKKRNKSIALTNGNVNIATTKIIGKKGI
jgi:hypothetical protein